MMVFVKMAVMGACRCYAPTSGPCSCAQLAAAVMEDIAVLSEEVRDDEIYNHRSKISCTDDWYSRGQGK